MMNNFYITSGVGSGQTELNSFDCALFNSGVANYNLVRISSILPPCSEECTSVCLKEGAILHTAYAAISSKISNKTISAAIAVGIPIDNAKIGVIMEFSDYCNKDVALKKVSTMVEDAMRLRGYQVKEIKTSVAETVSNGNGFVTAFAGIAIW